ncbi:hypothetical protein BJX76DRAFT_350855 [Aspergillus varians]
MESLPSETLLEIFSYLPPCKSHIITVSHQWFHHLRLVLWKEVDNRRLTKVPRERRQIYACAIKSLILTSDDPREHEELGALDFARHNTLQLRISLNRLDSPLDTACLTGYLVPTLTSVTLDLVADQGLLDRLASNCGNLRFIALDLYAPRLAEKSVLDFLGRCPSLVHARFYSRHEYHPGPYGSTISQKFLHLVTQRSLKRLDFYQTITQSTVTAADLESIPQVFGSLERLEIHRSFKHIFPILLESVRSIPQFSVLLPRRHLCSPIIDASSTSLLLQLTRLRYLDIRFGHPAIMWPDDVVSLRELSHLRVLRLNANGIKTRIPGLNDNHFRSLVSGLVELRQLTFFCARERLTAVCLIALAECCPYLCSCAIPRLNVNILYFQPYQHRLFPNLKGLLINMFVPEPIFTQWVQEEWEQIRKAKGQKMMLYWR